ncbi:MAG: zinc-dependent alcohol dehydrogenase family protein [Alphaproteobacteria bacterium]|nr:zinc-dependent alcohol dehydrogenase family protein [Alphaproteobacteria bacterium]
MPKIVRFYQTGAPEVLKLIEEPLIAPRKGEVRIKVEAIGLNHAELMLREGAYAADPVLPSRIGIEAAGTIDALGPGVRGLAVGDKVAAVPFLSWDKFGYWTSDSLKNYGVYGESAVVPAYTVAHSPANISAVEAAAIWCQYLTAWGALVEHAKVGKKDFVLITASSSSAALGGLQIAKLEGATVIAQTRTRAKLDFLFSAGADHVIVSDEESVPERVREITAGQGFTVCYDPIGGHFMSELVTAAQPCGLIINYGNLDTRPINVPILPILTKRIYFKFHSVFDSVRIPRSRARGYKYVHDNVAAGRLKVIVDRTFPLDQVVEAHRYMESNQQRGKIVVTVP